MSEITPQKHQQHLPKFEFILLPNSSLAETFTASFGATFRCHFETLQQTSYCQKNQASILLNYCLKSTNNRAKLLSKNQHLPCPIVIQNSNIVLSSCGSFFGPSLKLCGYQVSAVLKAWNFAHSPSQFV